MQKDSRYFPQRAFVERQTEQYSVYRINQTDGFGRMTVYMVMPGILLIYNDFHTFEGFEAEGVQPGVVELNHCLRGRYESIMPDGRTIYLGAQDFAASDRSRPPRASAFTLGEYYGASLMIEVGEAARSVDRMLGPGAIDLRTLFERLFWDTSYMIMRTDSKISHIFSEFYDESLREHQPYLQIKVLELLLFLDLQKEVGWDKPRQYYTRSQASRIKAIEQRLTRDLKVQLPLADLAEEYKISQTTLMKHFQAVYGLSPYAYLKKRRMEVAALLLQTTNWPIGEIAAEVGYQNASKFSAAFASIYGLSPREYRKGAILD